jgi:hypothetical protein
VRRRPSAWQPFPAACLAAALLIAALAPTLATGQAATVRGRDSVFAEHGVLIAWAVLKNPVEAESQVVIRIIVTGESYEDIGIEAVEPFSHTRRPVLAPEPVVTRLDLRSLRADFADFPRREIHLYRTDEDARAGRPALTVEYAGIPETTPEFASDAALLGYLEAAVVKARGTTP